MEGRVLMISVNRKSGFTHRLVGVVICWAPIIKGDKCLAGAGESAENSPFGYLQDFRYFFTREALDRAQYEADGEGRRHFDESAAHDLRLYHLMTEVV